jgi:three-Cys-motif partner protein
MTSEAQEPVVGPWAREKLASLKAYLEYYTKVLKNQPWLEATWFIDAFAGAGMARVRGTDLGSVSDTAPLFGDLTDEDAQAEELAYIKGSPRVALEIANPFSHYVFIEKQTDRARDLANLTSEYPSRSIEVRVGNANTELSLLLARRINWQANRGVVFLDPYGMQTSWSTIAAIARTGALEVIINFPLHMAIDRVLMRTGEIPKAWSDRLDDMFGSVEWRDLVYETKADLLGGTVSKRDDATKRLLEWYRKRLFTAFGHVSTAQPVKNSRGRILYYLIWAGPHQKGLVGANYILGRKIKGALS